MNKLSILKRVCILSVLCAATAVGLPAQTLRTLHNFDGTDGFWTLAGLIQGANGDLYGTTWRGGMPSGEAGTAFDITPGGTFATLYDFCSGSPTCTDGDWPFDGLIQDTDGNLYGTTEEGGANGGGMVFRITPNGTLTTIYSFCSQKAGILCLDGSDPRGGVLKAPDGNFYGTTFTGGTDGDCYAYGPGCGTVFRLTPSGILTTLHSFQYTDGATPWAGLVLGTDGNFYGTTWSGGQDSELCIFTGSCGTVFKITPSGMLTTLHTFCSQSGCTDGGSPAAGVVQGPDGNMYGTTAFGGVAGSCGYGSCGTVFQVTPGSKLTIVHDFLGADGEQPYGQLILASDGSFYGTTNFGGAYPTCGTYQPPGCGTAFQLTLRGTLTTLHSFDGTDGNQPYAGLLQDTNGIFYGTTYEGGATDNGTVFALSMDLGPFVKTNPVAGKAGETVGILGTNLTGATSVTFNGTQTAFRVVSKTFIEAKVPSGATSGTVQVQLPSAMLSSNVPFIVSQDGDVYEKDLARTLPR